MLELFRVLAHPESSNGAALYGGVIGDLGLLTAWGGWWLHRRCDTPGCMRRGRYKTSDGHHTLCRVCHPDFPSHRLSLDEIVQRHEEHNRRREELR